ncbi:MAG: nucleotidyltransferase family protein [Caldilineaceae bacterium]
MLADFPIDDPIIARLLILLHADPAAGDLAEALAMDMAEWTAVLSLATDQHVHPYLYWNLRRLDALSALPEALHRQLHASYMSNAARNRALLHFVEQILTAFAERHLPVIVLKGTYLVDHVYPSLGARVVGDTDLLLPAGRIAEAVTVLESLGYVGSEPFSPAFLTVDKHLGFYQRGGHLVELHYELMVPQKPMPVPVAEIWKRAVPATVAGCPVLVLAPEDQLLHLCIHGTLQHQLHFDMRFLTDIVVYSQYVAQRLDWQVLVARVRRMGWGHSVWLALTLASRLLGAPIPAEICAQLRPAVLDTSILDKAVNQLFASDRAGRTANREFARLWDPTQRMEARARQIFSRIFPSRVELAARYHISPEAPRLPLYYALRVKDLAYEYLPLAWRMWRGETKTHTAVLQTAQLDNWLSTPTPPFEAGQEPTGVTDA